MLRLARKWTCSNTTSQAQQGIARLNASCSSRPVAVEICAGLCFSSAAFTAAAWRAACAANKGGEFAARRGCLRRTRRGPTGRGRCASALPEIITFAAGMPVAFSTAVRVASTISRGVPMRSRATQGDAGAAVGGNHSPWRGAGRACLRRRAAKVATRAIGAAGRRLMSDTSGRWR